MKYPAWPRPVSKIRAGPIFGPRAPFPRTFLLHSIIKHGCHSVYSCQYPFTVFCFPDHIPTFGREALLHFITAAFPTDYRLVNRSSFAATCICANKIPFGKVRVSSGPPVPAGSRQFTPQQNVRSTIKDPILECSLAAYSGCWRSRFGVRSSVCRTNSWPDTDLCGVEVIIVVRL